MKAWLYILQSESNGTYYIGSTTDIERRFSEHNRGQTTSTRSRGPWKLVFKYETIQGEASRLERKLKQL